MLQSSVTAGEGDLGTPNLCDPSWSPQHLSGAQGQLPSHFCQRGLHALPHGDVRPRPLHASKVSGNVSDWPHCS